MNEYQTDFSSLFADGRMVRVMAFGDSLTSGTGSLSGWRSPFKKIMNTWGYAQWEFVGGLTTQQEDLGNFGRDWRHEGNGGYRVDQLTGIVRNRIETYQPDVLICLSGNNTTGSPDRAAAKALYDALFAEMFAADNLRVLSLSRTPINSSGVIGMDTIVEAMINGHKDACRTQQRLGRRVAHASPHDFMTARWAPQWYLSGDNTHFNAIGYAHLARGIATALVGGPRSLALTPPVQGETLASVPADVDYPGGAEVTKTAAADTVAVVHYGGSTATIPASWPVGVPWPVPVARILNAGTSLSAPLVVARHRFGVL
ncbi:MAG: hypothetical protein KF812_02205 [Fimbriimonadaceae bacterium]|nr:hypothetical protein [Fimbriimonadaceae bacterium]